MHDTYTKLMLRQDLSAETDAAFYEKLESTQAKKKMNPMVRAAVILVCIGLLIPATVWAAETIFGVTKVTHTHRPTYNDNPGIGLDITFKNIEDYPIEAFSEHLQELKDYETVLHESWADAESYLGIDLVDNIHFTAKDTYRRPAFMDSSHITTGMSHHKHSQALKRFGKNAQTVCGTYEEQLFFSTVNAEYERDQTVFRIQACISVDIPDEIKEDIYNYYHGYSITYDDRYNTTVETEHYMTAAGIPVLITTVTSEENYNDSKPYNDWEQLVDCTAFFAVNDVSYRIDTYCASYGTGDQYASPKEKVMPALLEFLDGFVIE